jgi:hypothetical protein
MAIEVIDGTPKGVLGFRGVGTVTADDYRAVLDPAIARVVAEEGTLNVVYVLGDDFEHYSLGAMWQDAKLEGVPHRAWGRMALVTGHSGVAELVHLFAFAFPGEVRIFPLNGESDALAWASGE